MSQGSGFQRRLPNVRLPHFRLPELRMREWRVIRDRSRDRSFRSSSRLFNRRILLRVVFSIVAAVAFAGGLLQTHMFTVQRIDVTGSSHLSRDDILQMAHLRTGVSIATVNASASEKRLERHPWVLHARVTPDWPHGVKVAIVEQRAVAVAQTADKKWVQLGPDGTVLAVGDKPVSKIPALLNVRAPAEVGAVVDPAYAPLMNVASLMPQSLQPRVVQMDVFNNTFRLGLDAGTVVNLGDGTDMAEKLLSAASVVAHTDPKTLQELDVTSPRFPVARPVGQAQSTKSTATTSTTVASKAKKTPGTTTTVPRGTSPR